MSIRPVPPELAPYEKAIGESVLTGQRGFVQHLVDPAEEALVIEALIAEGDCRRACHLIARVGADALQRHRRIGLVHLVS